MKVEAEITCLPKAQYLQVVSVLGGVLGPKNVADLMLPRPMSSRRRKIQRRGQHPHQPSTGSNDSNEDIHGVPSNDYFQQETLDVGIDQFLELDPRPTFVLNFKPSNQYPLQPVFLNASLRSDQHLSSKVTVHLQVDADSLALNSVELAFESWITQIAAGDASPTFFIYNLTWTGFLVKHLVVVSGQREVTVPNPDRHPQPRLPSPNSLDPPSDQRRPRNALTILEDIDSLLDSNPNPSVTSFVTTGTPDWTVETPEGELSAHIQWVRSIDWGSTPLGAMSTWSPEFRQIACLLMAQPHSAALFWGDELTVLYNQAYGEREAGNKHPSLMGTNLAGSCGEVWHLISPIFEECKRTGKGFSVNDQLLSVERRGFLEETYYTWSLTPLYGGTKNLLGFYSAPFETTSQIRSARALKTLLKLGQEMALAQSLTQFWSKILSGLSDNGFDFPFAILYSVVNTEDTSAVRPDSCQPLSACVLEGDSECSDNYLSHKCCHLEGTLGVPAGHPAAPSRMDLKDSGGIYVTAFRDAMHSGEPKLLSIEDGTFPTSLLENIEWRGFGDSCREALVCPIRPIHTTTGENVLGFLVIGVNPRREFDEDYQSFIQLLDRQLATSLASVTLAETEIRRSQVAAEAAALERSRLSEELAVERSRLERIAEISQVGMFSINPQGLLLEANHHWFEMTGHSRSAIYEMSWIETVHENSLALVRAAWTRLTVSQLPWTGELQLKKPSLDAVTEDEADKGTWISAACHPEFADGQLRSVMGSITDISRKKWKEALQATRLQEAEEIRRAQNNFIDITSHEMRNPLSAILQCADGISLSLAEFMESHELTPLGQIAIKECISNAETIQLCAQHQKSIVDDILTISKLDSNLLLITPVAIRPVEIVLQALQMFVVECQKTHDIKLEFHIDQSLQDLGIDLVMLDSSRLLQILINLLTNAIKFTKASEKRTIDVLLGAYLEPPTHQGLEFQYFPSPNNKGRMDVTSAVEWGNGEVVYLRFEVKDSGCGLKPEEKKKLFNRFSQASPRTHVQYGGSGLGLFISRQLTELQGGEIGVASKEGEGSTFAFYIKARRTDTTEDERKSALKRRSWDVQSNTSTTPDSLDSLDSQEHHDKHTSALLALSEIPAINPNNWHILIVEDNLVNQRILAQQIRKLGATVYIANHGGEALSVIQESKYYTGREHDGKELSVILMDLEMPVMDGLTCVRRIREMEQEGLVRARLPIIAVTANARDEQIGMARDSGMDDVMPKPFRIVQIKAKIEALLRKMVDST